MVHDHKNQHGSKLHMLECRNSPSVRNSIIVSAVVNLSMSIVQIVFGLLTKSSGLLADGFHTLSDLFSDFIVLVTGIFSQKEADEDHQYGHYRYEDVSAFFLGMSLLAIGASIVWSSSKRMLVGNIQSVGITPLFVSISMIVIKELLFRYMLGVAKTANSSMLIANAWHARSDALSSLVVCLGIIGNRCGYPFLDQLAGIIVGLIIARMGLLFSYDSFNALTDHATSEVTYKKIREIILSTPGVHGCHDIKTRTVGGMILVDVHIEVDGNISVRKGHDIAVEAIRRVTLQLPVLNVMTHIDPV